MPSRDKLAEFVQRCVVHIAGSATVGSMFPKLLRLAESESEWWHRPMNKLKLICLAVIQSVKQAWLLPQTVANVVRQRRWQVVLNEHEVERLDRMRNPSKYLGK